MLHRYESEGAHRVKKTLKKKAAEEEEDSVLESEDSTDEEMDMDTGAEENTTNSLNQVNASKEVMI